MKILKKPIFWALVGGVLFTTLIFILIPATFPTVNTISDANADEVFTRFKLKIGATPAGRHYLELISRHKDELNEIYNNAPDHEEHRENLSQLIRVFKPVMQDLLEENGNKVQITREQIALLQNELDWIAREGSPALRQDVEEEWQHFQLEIFVGMTLSEAMDFLSADLPSQVAAEPIMSTALAPEPTPETVCIIGVDADCQIKPSMVPDSNGQWAYANLKGLYFEYPADWRLESYENPPVNNLFFKAPADSIAELKTTGGYITIRDDALSTDFPPYDNPVWIQQISLPDFEGQAAMLEYSSGARYILQAHLYDENHKRMVYFAATINDGQTSTLTTPEIVEENVTRFKHMVESVKIWNETDSLQPTAVGTPLVADGGLVSPNIAMEWTQEIVNGVSFEYPADWQMRLSEGPESQFRFFVPAPASFEALHTHETILGVIQNVVVPENIPLDELSCSTDHFIPQHPSLWHQALTIDDFEGSQFLWEDTDGALIYLEVVLYNRDLQQMICMAMKINPHTLDEWSSSQDIMNETFPNFYHMLESIKIADE